MNSIDLNKIAVEVRQKTYPDWNVDIDRWVQEFAHRLLARLAEEGFVLVPKEPTEEMLEALKTGSEFMEEGTVYDAICLEYRAMLSAALRIGGQATVQAASSASLDKE